jgi:hypothetical protein
MPYPILNMAEFLITARNVKDYIKKIMLSKGGLMFMCRWETVTLFLEKSQ